MTRLPTRYERIAGWHVSAILLGVTLTWPGASAATLAGKWNFGGEFVDVSEVDGSVIFEYQGTAFSATLRGPVLSGPSPQGVWNFAIDAIVSPDQQRLVAFILRQDPPYSLNGLIASGRIVEARRCSCFDGNAADGDGCDTACQVEPCFTCSGEPSVCAPTRDGSACDDGRVCTTGETCVAGSCDGGTAVTPCVDLTGSWEWVVTDEIVPEPHPGVRVELEQTGDYVEARYPSGPIFAAGPIDPATGAFHLLGVAKSWYEAVGGGCPPDMTDGEVSADGKSLTAEGTFTVVVSRCIPIGVMITGNRVPCAGDCDGDGELVVSEVVRSTSIALGVLPLDTCPSIDVDRDGTAQINEVVTAVNHLLSGCDD